MTRLTVIGLIALWAFAVSGAMRAEQLTLIGRPCRARQVLAGRCVVDRKSGRELFVITNMNENSGAELIFIDPEKNSARVVKAPAGAGSWALDEVPGDRLVVGTFYDGRFMVYDLKHGKFTTTAAVPGETYIWNQAMGSDGRLYGGTYGNGKLAALDLKSYAVEDLGAPTPPNQYLRYVSATPDGRILCSFGMEKPTTRLFDPATKRFDNVPPQLEGVTTAITWNGTFLAGATAYQGSDLHVVSPPPFPLPSTAKGGWGVDVYLTTPDVLFLRQNNAVWRYAKGDAKLTLIADIDLRGGRLLAGDRKGRVLGVRGQDYFVVSPGDTTLKLRPIPGVSGPRNSLFLKVDANGTLWGGPTFGQTLWWMDPKNRKPVNTGSITDGGGEVYDATFLDGVTYAASYAGGDITRYDPKQPWNQLDHVNPKTIATVGERGYIRPVGGLHVGPYRKLYTGWMAKYGTYGGAISITDPATGQTRLIENPLGEQAIEGLAINDRYAFVGTSLTANGLPKKQGESARFGVVDLESGKTVFRQEFPGAEGVRPVMIDAKTGRVAFAVGSKWKLFDPAKMEILPNLSDETPKNSANLVAAPGDGMLYYGGGKSVITLDLATGATHVLADAPESVSNVAVGPKGEIYVTCGMSVYRVSR